MSPRVESRPSYRPSVESGQVIETTEIWRDATRNRQIAVKIYAPSSGASCPLVIFSHGLGSSREGYAFLGRAWAARGIISIHPQHPGSDSEVLRTRGIRGIYRAAYDDAEYVDRPLDLQFVLDEVRRRADLPSPASPFSRIDFQRIGVAGHSYGAHTALLLSGMLMNLPKEPGRSFRDARVKAALLLSIPTMEYSPTPKEFAPISIPTMFMTGTKDTSFIWRTKLSHRRRGFDSIVGVQRYLLTIDRATHGSFADHETMKMAKRNGRLDRSEPLVVASRTPEEQREVDLIVDYSVAFWEAWLREVPSAQEWLRSATPDGARFEQRQ